MDEEHKDLLEGRPAIVNIGLFEFFESLEAQGVESIHVDWRPPAAGDQDLLSLLDGLL